MPCQRGDSSTGRSMGDLRWVADDFRRSELTDPHIRQVRLLVMVLAAVWSVVAVWSWVAAYWPHDSTALLRPTFTFVPVFSLMPPAAYLLWGLAVPRWPVAIIGSAPFIAWGVPHYLRLATDVSLKYSRPGVYHWYVTNRVLVASLVALSFASGLLLFRLRQK